MTYKIIGDSCLDLTREMRKDPRFQTIPLTLQVGDTQVVDDETFDQKKFIELVKACPECPKTACPSPEMFKEAYEAADAEAIFVITLSSHLSGSYNSAAVAKKMYEEEMEESGRKGQRKKIALIDSLSASSGELNLALLIQSLCASGLDFEEVEKGLWSIGIRCALILSWKAWTLCARMDVFPVFRHFLQQLLTSSQ